MLEHKPASENTPNYNLFFEDDTLRLASDFYADYNLSEPGEGHVEEGTTVFCLKMAFIDCPLNGQRMLSLVLRCING